MCGEVRKATRVQEESQVQSFIENFRENSIENRIESSIESSIENWREIYMESSTWEFLLRNGFSRSDAGFSRHCSLHPIGFK